MKGFIEKFLCEIEDSPSNLSKTYFGITHAITDQFLLEAYETLVNVFRCVTQFLASL